VLADMPQVLSIERRPEPCPANPVSATTAGKASPGALVNPGGTLGKN
jgi:hypothetical protein